MKQGTQRCFFQPGRHDVIWVLTPLMILVYMLTLSRASIGPFFDDPKVRQVYAYLGTFCAMLLVPLAAAVVRQPQPGLEAGAAGRAGAGSWRDYLQMTKPGLNG